MSSSIEWLIAHGLPSVFVIASVAAAIYVVRDRIGERIGKAWREVAEAHEQRVEQLEDIVKRQAAEIAVLKGQVAMLAERPDLTEHEARAQERHVALLAELERLIAVLGDNPPAHMRF